MRSALAFTSLSLGASALVPPMPVLPRSDSGKCIVTFEGHGGETAHGLVGQLYDGQNRIGSHLPTGEYTIDRNNHGKMWDGKGRGCIMTPPTSQWQCDEGAEPSPGFDVGCDNKLTRNGTYEWSACPVNNNGEWNLYGHADFGQKKCTTVTITAKGDCQPKCPIPGPSSSAPSDCGEHGKKCTPAPTPSKNDCEGGKCKPAPSTSSAPVPSESKPVCDDKHKDKCTPGPSTSTPVCDEKHKDKCKPTTPTSTRTSTVISTVTSKPTCDDKHKGNCTPATPAIPTSTPGCDDKHKGNCTPSSPMPTPSKGNCDKGKHGDECESGNGCPADLEGEFEYPHLIIPVDKSQPNKSGHNGLFPKITGEYCTVFSFDIHPRFAGKTCSLVFLFPEKEDLETSSFEYKSYGASSLSFYHSEKAADEGVSWSGMGDMKLMGEIDNCKPGKNYAVSSENCAAGTRQSVVVCGKDIHLEYFQDFNPEPIGVYYRTC